MKLPRLRLTRLRYRIVAVFIGLLLLVQLASLGLVSHSIERSARAAIDTELATGQRVFERVLALRAARLADTARVLAADFGFRDAVASEDDQTLVAALDHHARRVQAGVALFTDAKFRLKAATQPGGERFVPLLADTAAERDAPARIVSLDGQAYQLVVVPVKAPALIGWVTLGFAIDDALLGEIRQLSTVEVSLMGRQAAPARWEPMRSTLGAGTSLALVDPWRAAHDAQPRRDGQAATGTRVEFATPATALTAGSHRIVASEVELAHGASGEPQVLALLMRSVDEVTAPYDRLTAILLGCTVTAIVVFALGSVVTAHRITTPLNRLARSARRLSQGVYDEVVEVRHSDEIGALAGAFESMRQAVQEREREVKRIAYEDRLTSLPNRERFRIELHRAIDAATRAHGGCAVLQLELDRFEQINEVLGHRFGDGLLREVARRLVEQGRRSEHDVVARIGGNDFALVLPGADARAALEAAERVHRLLEQPFRLGDQTIDLGGVIGVACHPEHASDADVLAGRAAIAQLEARRRRMSVMLYDSVMDSDSAESLSLMSELRHALEHDQLRLHLQPKIALATGRVIGAEALVRWQHPTRGLVPPIKFIPFAEQTGFIRELTAWVLARSTHLLKRLHAEGNRMKLSVNLSTRDLLDHDLPARLRRMVVTQGIEPRCLCLEITESAIMDDPQRAMLTLEALHDMGFKLSIDDFGTGYSSLAYLKTMPVDELKIDKSFVLNMERDLDDAKIVRSTVDLAHNLGLTVVAEGVENVKAWKLLQSLGCDEAQGYFIAKPMPEALFADWVQGWQSPALNAVRLDTDFARLAETK